MDQNNKKIDSLFDGLEGIFEDENTNSTTNNNSQIDQTIYKSKIITPSQTNQNSTKNISIPIIANKKVFKKANYVKIQFYLKSDSQEFAFLNEFMKQNKLKSTQALKYIIEDFIKRNN